MKTRILELAEQITKRETECVEKLYQQIGSPNPRKITLETRNLEDCAPEYLKVKEYRFRHNETKVILGSVVVSLKYNPETNAINFKSTFNS